MRIAPDRRAAVEALITEFGWRVDNGHGHTVAELFTVDATVDTPHFNLSGREEIDSWFTERAGAGNNRLSRHYSTNLRITEDGENRYSVTANAMTLVGTPPAPSHGTKIAAGASRDIVLFEGDVARFASRELSILFEGKIEAPEVAA